MTLMAGPAAGHVLRSNRSAPGEGSSSGRTDGLAETLAAAGQSIVGLSRPCSFASLRWRYPAKRRSPAPWQSSPPDPARIRGQGSSTVRTRKVLRTGKRAATGRGKESRSFLILTRELGLAACLAESWLRRRAQNNGFRLEWQLLSGNLSVSWGLRVSSWLKLQNKYL